MSTTPIQGQLFASSESSSERSAPSSPDSSAPKPSSRSKPSSDASPGQKRTRAKAKSTFATVVSADGSTVAVKLTAGRKGQPVPLASTPRHTPDPALAIPRPRTRADCVRGMEARPCPWVGCKHHLALEEAEASSPSTAAEVSNENASPNDESKRRPRTLRLNMPRRPFDPERKGRRQGLASSDAEVLVRGWLEDAAELVATQRYSCALDVAEDHPDGLPSSVIGELLGCSEQAVEDVVHEPHVREAARELYRIRHGHDAE